jgi:hypothetical protein
VRPADCDGPPDEFGIGSAHAGRGIVAWRTRAGWINSAHTRHAADGRRRYSSRKQDGFCPCRGRPRGIACAWHAGHAVTTIAQLISHARGINQITPFDPNGNAPTGGATDVDKDTGRWPDLDDVRAGARKASDGSGGSRRARPAHDRGPPGSGKTILARAPPSIPPEMTSDEALEVTKIYSVDGLLPPGSPLVGRRPFRSPHYTISNAGLVGAGAIPGPGEITLRHRGCCFSMRARNSVTQRWKCCSNRWKPAS